MTGILAASLAAIATVALAAAVAMLLRRQLFFFTRVESWSMWPTLRPGQWVFTVVRRRKHRIRHGHVVVIDSAELNRTLVKRVAGLPGDRVGGTTVPDGQVYLVGDNRAYSNDSRHWDRPFLPIAAIRGRVVLGFPRRSAGKRTGTQRLLITDLHEPPRTETDGSGVLPG